MSALHGTGVDATTGCGCGGTGAGCAQNCGQVFDGVDLSADPFTALRVTYGMLLSEPDFEVLMGNPRGKGMLHAAWLHGRGLVWGLGVSLAPPPAGRKTGGILRVEKGLAIDGWGRELRLDVAECLDLGAWATERIRLAPEGDAPTDPAKDPGSGKSGDVEQGDVEQEDGSSAAHEDDPDHAIRTLHGWVVAEFATCLDHPVPTLADPCDVTRRHDVCSRVVETARIRACETAPSPSSDRLRVRQLLGLDCEPHAPGPPTCGSPTCTNPEHQADAVDPEVTAARKAISRAGAGQRACVLLREVRRLAALDAETLAPAVEEGDVVGLFPVTENDAGVVLARLTVRVSGDGDCVRVEDVEVDLSDRRALLPTVTIQDLVAGLAPGVLGEVSPPDAGGPRLVDGSLSWSPDRTRLEFRLTAAAIRGSLEGAVSISSLSPENGWAHDEVSGVSMHDQGRRVVVYLDRPPAHSLVRVRIRGTGDTPIVGRHPVAPFAGHENSPPGSADDGHDAVVMRRLPHHRNGNGNDGHGDDGYGNDGHDDDGYGNGDRDGNGGHGDDGHRKGGDASDDDEYGSSAGRDRT
jgi:hypothetical protein